MANLNCPKCYELDDLGLIRKFLCSRYGWNRGMPRCMCKHHRSDVSLYQVTAGRLG